jgi:hypothetical protein
LITKEFSQISQVHRSGEMGKLGFSITIDISWAGVFNIRGCHYEVQVTDIYSG